jgi:acetyl esterase
MSRQVENTVLTETDYAERIDAETWDFIRKTESYYPPDTINMSIAGQRDVYGRLCNAFRCDYPEGVTAQDRNADGVPVRCYKKIDTEAVAVVLYFHGGGFVVGGLDSHDDICAEICDQTGFAVVSVDYRLAPENVYPVDYEDCMKAFHWVGRKYQKPLVLVGDSAGGTLAAAVAHSTRHTKPSVAGQVLIYPALGKAKETGSYITHANAPLLTLEDIVFYHDIRAGSADVSGDATYTPLSGSDFSGLPPTVAISAECDPICDDAEDYCLAIQQAGGQAVWIKEVGLVHGYLRARHTVGRARKSFSRIVEAINRVGS